MKSFLKILLRILAVILIIFGILGCLVGISSIIDGEKDLGSMIAMIVILGIVPIACGILLFRQTTHSDRDSRQISEGNDLTKEDVEDLRDIDDKKSSINDVTSIDDLIKEDDESSRHVNKERKPEADKKSAKETTVTVQEKTNINFLFNLFPYFIFSRLINQIFNNKNDWKKTIEEHQSSDKRFKPNNLHKFGLLLYKKFLENFLIDLFISDDEQKILAEIADYFGLNNSEINSSKKKFAEKSMKKLVEKKVSNRILSDDDKQHLLSLAGFLEFPENKLIKLIIEYAMKVFNQSKDKILSSRRVSPKEEEELQNLAKNLGLSNGNIQELMNENDKSAFTYYRLLYEVENGNLPEMQAPINLMKGEICHITIDAVMVEELKEETRKNSGQLGVTNKKIFFDSDKNVSIPLNQIEKINYYTNYLEIKKMNRQSYYEFEIDKDKSEFVNLIIRNVMKKRSTLL
ncbi:MAG: hypothetical protein FWH53_00015 [Leptospirales bacterium]|nr:hypothetical protein [Leptospirales bacterium]